MWAGSNQVPRAIPTEHNANLLRGIVWHCALLDDDALATAVARAAEACFKKLPEVGARCTKAGNACLWALGAMPGGKGAPHLVRLQGKVKQPSARGRLETTLDQTAERVGVTREALEDQAVPTHGLEHGPPRTTVGEYVAEIVVRGPTDVAVEWQGADRARLAEPPAALRKAHAAELKRVDQAAGEIRKTLAAQRLRVERLLMTENWWSYGRWRELYLEHPLLQVLAQRLIWAFGDAEQPTLGAWLDGQLVDVDDRPLDGLADDTQVRLWHPILTPADTVLAWRRWLERHAVTQPFKQAHREIYILTDAERETGDHSNRFAQHILRQHQFRALCLERGWQYGLQGSFDSADTATPTLSLPRWKLTVQFDVEPIEDDELMTPNGIFRYVTTDAVRFTRATPDSARTVQQAMRREIRRRALEILRGAQPGALREIVEESLAVLPAPPEPVLLAEVPPVVFSEVMRDVDLFVGVCSVGTDPTWGDGAPADHAGYWERFAFGELTPSAQTRRAVLERSVPRLAIAPRCTLEARFLVVRGDLRTYRIHLGSGNIQMEPNNQYLCIVPAKSPSPFPGEPGHIYLPFEGDSTMAVILSKAFLLANDTAIKDPSITRQIHAR
jgi:hypothetical protein